MKKSLVIGGIVLVGLAGGGFALTKVLEGRTEQLVSDTLTKAATSADSVSYSLWQNQLELAGVQFKFDVAGQNIKGRVESIALSGFDPDCLNPDAQGLPRVAETLVMSGLTWDSQMTDPVSGADGTATITSQEIRMEDWYQNLGRLVSQKWLSEGFWTEAYRYKLAMASVKNYTVKVSLKDTPTVTEHVALLGLLGPVNGDAPDAVTNGNLAGRTTSFFANDITFDMPTMIKMTVARTEMHDVVMPAPADMVALLELSQKMEANPDDTATAMEFLKRLGKAYENVSPCRTLLLQGMAIDGQGQDIPAIRVQEIKETLATGASPSFGLSFTGLNIAVTKEQLAEFAPLDAFLPQAEKDGLSTDAAFTLTVAPEAVGPSRLDWSTSTFGLADAKGSIDFALAVASLKDLISPNVDMEKVLKFKETTLDYQDKGLVAAIAAVMGDQEGVSAQEAQRMMLAEVPSAVGSFGPLGQPLAEALTILLENPGKLTASLSFGKAVLFEQAAMMLLMVPESVQLKAQAEPGKPFADWLPASLK